ncbi:MAG: tail fiber domain-containing protein [Alphaproteobacteria bacterium]|nr:tail fiber domain-containing protein [Alphaproteobacteria bacterium]
MVKRFFNKQNGARSRWGESGNIFFTMFGAVALVGAVGAASMTVMKGPVRAMSEITKRTIAENNMIASGKLSLTASANAANGGDCDSDGHVEPIQFVVATPNPTGGGQLPPSIGAALQDPWQTNYGYCVWDHGTTIGDTGADCIDPVAANNRLAGENTQTGIALAIVSAGPDRIFQTVCNAYPTATPVNKNGSDDLILSYTYAEAASGSGGLWNLKSGSPEIAEIGGKDIEVVGSQGAGTASIGYDAGLGIAGVGQFMAIKTDDIYSNAAAFVQMQSPLHVKSTLYMEDIFRAENRSGIAAPTGGASGAVIDDLGDVDTTGKALNDLLTWDGTNWVAQANPFTESDPQVGTLTGSKWCTAEVGGAFIDCTDDGPAMDNLGNHTATMALDMATNDIDNAGTITATSYVHTSDRRLKDNIETVANPFDLLEAISGKHYTWKKDGSPAYGVIAQDVETVMPEAVHTDEATGMKAVDYDQLLSPLIEAVKTQNRQIKAQQAQIEALLRDIDALEAEE